MGHENYMQCGILPWILTQKKAISGAKAYQEHTHKVNKGNQEKMHPKEQHKVS